MFFILSAADSNEALSRSLELNEMFSKPLLEVEVIRDIKSATRAYENKLYKYTNAKLIDRLDIDEKEQRELNSIIRGIRDMNKRVTILVATLLSCSVVVLIMVGGIPKGYQADERNMAKGIEVFEREFLNYKSIDDYFYSMHSIFFDMENASSDEVIFESYYAKDNKQNDDMLFGILKENIKVLDKFPSMTCEEMVKDFYMDDAPKEDMLEFQKKVSPIIKDMSFLLKEIVSNPEFDGTITKEQSSRINELMFDEYKVYYNNYFSKSYEK